MRGDRWWRWKSPWLGSCGQWQWQVLWCVSGRNNAECRILRLTAVSLKCVRYTIHRPCEIFQWAGTELNQSVTLIFQYVTAGGVCIQLLNFSVTAVILRSVTEKNSHNFRSNRILLSNYSVIQNLENNTFCQNNIVCSIYCYPL